MTGEPESRATASETVLSAVCSYLRKVVGSRPAANTWRTVRDACVLVVVACVDSYRAAWARARRAALMPAELEAGLAQRPYDLRYACASLLFYIGIAPPEITRRLGHTIEVLMRTYTRWFTGQINTANSQLKTALDELGPLTGHGPDGSDNSSHNRS